MIEIGTRWHWPRWRTTACAPVRNNYRTRGACRELHGVYRRLLQMALEELQTIELQMEQLDREITQLLKPHEDAVLRLAEVPGLGVESAQQIIAEIGPAAAVFSSAGSLASWVGVCPGEEQSASESKSSRSPKGNRNMRRLLNQAAMPQSR